MREQGRSLNATNRGDEPDGGAAEAWLVAREGAGRQVQGAGAWRCFCLFGGMWDWVMRPWCDVRKRRVFIHTHVYA